MATPVFTTRIEGNDIIVKLVLGNKSQEDVVKVWTPVGPLFGNNQAARLEAKRIVDDKIATMSIQDFAKWMKTVARVTVNA